MQDIKLAKFSEHIEMYDAIQFQSKNNIVVGHTLTIYLVMYDHIINIDRI